MTQNFYCKQKIGETKEKSQPRQADRLNNKKNKIRTGQSKNYVYFNV